MAEPIISFDRVSKKFRRGERHDTLKDLLPALVRRLARGRPVAGDLDTGEFWAIRDVSFEIPPGQAVGIIGPNGAGKSTTLKLLTRILRPTLGSCAVRGRVGALIEVAAGFHPDLTGRENIYLQGAVMGMPRRHVERRFDDIVDFSGISSFIDTQVKRYSSGMQARLGFSVAAFMDPDVLFVDEVLSVGDMSFQARCLERMREQIREGVTVVFVSHHLQAVSELCERALVFGSGSLLFDGPPADAIDVYLQASQTSSQRYNTQPKFRLVSSEFVRADGSPAHTISPHEPCRLDMVLECVEECPPVTVGVEIERTRDLFYCYGAASEELGIPRIAARPGDRVTIGVRFTAHFARGHYRLNVNLRDPDGQRFHFFAENAAHFTVAELVSYAGVVDVDLAITVADGRGALEGVGLTTAGLQGPSGRPA